MKNNHDTEILKGILEYCDIIHDHILRCGNSYEGLLADRLFQDGLCINIQQIGELIKQLSEEFKNQNKYKVPFRQIIGLRNRITHNYSSINLQIMWDIIKFDIPVLVDFCKENINNNQTLTNKNPDLDPKPPKFKP